uniref:Uncharacterized protein n=1 Tax=Pseudomonas phage HRDY3 TaxID=3236930 RepID=A0AB39CDJ7_9VIRU
MKNDLFSAILSGELDRMPPTTRQRMMGDTGNRFLTPGQPHSGYLSSAPNPIWPSEIAAAKKKKALRKTKKKMRQQSRKKK